MAGLLVIPDIAISMLAVLPTYLIPQHLIRGKSPLLSLPVIAWLLYDFTHHPDKEESAGAADYNLKYYLIKVSGYTTTITYIASLVFKYFGVGLFHAIGYLFGFIAFVAYVALKVFANYLEKNIMGPLQEQLSMGLHQEQLNTDKLDKKVINSLV